MCFTDVVIKALKLLFIYKTCHHMKTVNKYRNFIGLKFFNVYLLYNRHFPLNLSSVS